MQSAHIIFSSFLHLKVKTNRKNRRKNFFYYFYFFVLSLTKSFFLSFISKKKKKEMFDAGKLKLLNITKC